MQVLIYTGTLSDTIADVVFLLNIHSFIRSNILHWDMPIMLVPFRFVDSLTSTGVRCSSEVRAFTHGMMGCQIDPLWWTH